MMKLVVICLLFFLTPLHSQGHNSSPCKSTTNNNGYNDFRKKHFPQGFPRQTDKETWKAFLEKSGLCGRTKIQSFIDASSEYKLKKICRRGGKRYRDNLCISTSDFRLFEVESMKDNNGKCLVKAVKIDNKHIILACDKIGNECVPVHYQANPNDETSDKFNNYITEAWLP
uniref:Uncharacterized protein n=1 Tax=Lepisosteus oculatus TaxID=7918 RepID=W5LZL3_LEPOC